MTTHEVDVVVLGLGPGGEHTAIKLGRAGLDVVGVEERLVGGECPYFGCVPSKMMIARRRRDRAAPGGSPSSAAPPTVTPDWGPVAARIRDEATDDWNDQVAVDRLEDNGARFVRGRGRHHRPGQVEVGGDTYVAPQGRRAQHRHRAGRAADRRPRGHAVLDQPRRGEAHRAAGLADRRRRRSDRCRAGAGVRAVRRPGHRRRDGRPPAARATSPRPAGCSRRRSPPRASRC